VLTPALLSPEIGGGGWLRAELDVTLPRGAVVEAEAVATSRVDVVQKAAALAADASRTVGQRQDAIWNLFEHDPARVYRLTAPPAAGQPVAVPLFHLQGSWLWLRLKLVTPPGETPPAVGELRVFYPDASIVQQLPAVFRGRDNDPTGFLRSLVGVLETTSQGIDDRIAAIAAQLDPDTAPEPWLDYVARWLALPWDDALPPDAKRRLLRGAGELLERRGTRLGLERLLRALAGDRAAVRLTDMTVEHGPGRLGGRDCPGAARLPMLLTGPPRSAPLLGTRAVLGRARLGASADPLALLTPVLRIEIAAQRDVRERIEPLLDRLLDQYIPAGVRAHVTWRTTASRLSSIDPDGGEVLDALGPGRLGDDAEIGRVVLTGRRGRRLDGFGQGVGFRLS
jgi:phage tail-like protein